MPKPYSLSQLSHHTLWTLRAGLFADRNAIDVPAGGCVECSNVVFLDGFLRPRPGMVEYLASFPGTDPVYHVSNRIRSNAAPRTIAVTKNASGDITIYEHDGSTWSNRSSSLTLTGVAADGVYPTYTNFKNTWYFAPGNGEIIALTGDGIDATLLTDAQSNVLLRPPDAPRIITSNAARMFAANIVDPDSGERDGTQLWWCAHTRPDVWGEGVGAGTAGRVALMDDSQDITSLFSYADTLTVFKPRMIHVGRFVGDPGFYDFRILTHGPGSINQATLKRYRDTKYVCLGDENFYMGAPGSIPQAIGDAVEPRIRQVVDLENIHLSRALIDNDNHFYHAFMPDVLSGEVSRIFTCNLKEGSWFEGEIANEDIRVLDAESVRAGNWTEYGLLGSSDNKIYRMGIDLADDDGEEIECRWVSGVFTIENLTRNETQQGEVQSVRAFSETDGGVVDISVIHGDGLDKLTETDFGTQTFGSGHANLLTERVVGEHFQIALEMTASTAAYIAGIQAGWMRKGDTHR